jgi:sialate O-acetylesterase
MRKRIQIPAAWSGKDLSLDLGAIDDMDTTYFDSARIGGTEIPGSHDKPRHYTIPGKLVSAGEHVISIRMLDTGGPGGLMGADEQNTLKPVGLPNEAPIALAGEWKFHQGAKLSELPPIESPKLLNPNMATGAEQRHDRADPAFRDPRSDLVPGRIEPRPCPAVCEAVPRDDRGLAGQVGGA